MSVLDLLGDEINNVDGEEEQEGVSNTLGEQASTNIISTATSSATSSSTITQHQTSSSSITIQEPTTSTQKPVSTATNSKPWGKLVLVSTGCSDIPKEFFLSEDLITIGRMQTNNVRIFSKQQSKFVSRNHAQIKKINAFTFEIEDKGSMNGTLVNGKKIQSSRLKHGDLIIITGGPTANFNDYITVNDKKREMFQSEQDWKYELTTQLKQAFIYRFELLDQNAIMKSLSTAITEQTSILSKEEKSVENLSRDISVTQAQKPLVPDNKRKIDDTDLSTTSETGKKFKALSECCTSELTCCICYNLYVEPTVLECGHNFCKRCLYEWLAKNHSCPLCRKKLSKGSYPNRGLETILNTYVQHVSCADEQKLREDRIRLIQQKFDEDLAKLHGMIENAKAKKIKFLNIKDRWKLEEKRTFKNGVKQYFGKCREDFCNLVGMTENFVNNCTNEELIIACDNLEIPVAYMIVGQEIKTMRRVVDFDQTRQRLLNFWNASDNLFFI